MSECRRPRRRNARCAWPALGLPGSGRRQPGPDGRVLPRRGQALPLRPWKLVSRDAGAGRGSIRSGARPPRGEERQEEAQGGAGGAQAEPVMHGSAFPDGRCNLTAPALPSRHARQTSSSLHSRESALPVHPLRAHRALPRQRGDVGDGIARSAADPAGADGWRRIVGRPVPSESVLASPTTTTAKGTKAIAHVSAHQARSLSSFAPEA